MIKSGMVIGDRYEILNRIGSGGMSVVFKGRDQKLNRYVAIKVLKSEYREDKNFVRKFKEEAQAAACLAHPNIVNVYDVGEHFGDHYIVMELVEGITLKNYIERKGKLTIKEATSIAIQVSMGLEVAHNNDIIHRDIKPQNIMISKDGKVKVMDFGIAKAATSETIASNAMGSVHYTSPEQARGGYSDAKSDIYSLGIVMYEMVTGRVPFDGETTVAVAVKHLQEELPSPRVYCTELPISLEKIIYKCTEKIVAKRYVNMTELIADLKQSLQTPDINFVKTVNVDEAAKTIMITKDDLSQIKKETGSIRVPEEDYEEDAFEEEPDYFESVKTYKKDERKPQPYDYDEEEEDEEDNEEDDEIDARLEKIMTIGGIVAAIIILIIIIMLAGKIFGAGWFSGSSNKPGNQQQTEEPVETTVEMIELKGKTYEEAKEALNKMGLGIESAGTEASDTYEEGQIVKQSVEAGKTIEKNTTIQVVLASEKVELVMIPNVINQTKDDAKYRLEQEGFKVDFTEAFDETIKEGKVIKTSPEVGTEQEKGVTIFLTISKGPETKYTDVPKILGLSREDAEAAIKNAKLNVGNVTEEYSDTVEKGLVISQNPTDGHSVEEGMSISFVVSKGKEKIYMPDLWGNPEDRAREKLEALGLELIIESIEEYNDMTEGRVFQTTPAADKQLKKGATVKIYISKGSKPEETSPSQDDTTQSDSDNDGDVSGSETDNDGTDTPEQ